MRSNIETLKFEGVGKHSHFTTIMSFLIGGVWLFSNENCMGEIGDTGRILRDGSMYLVVVMNEWSSGSTTPLSTDGARNYPFKRSSERLSDTLRYRSF